MRRSTTKIFITTLFVLAAIRAHASGGLVPDYVRLQYAGSVGLLNVGMGWQYGRHRLWETDAMFGIIPRYHTRHVKATFTLRESYVPFNCHLAGSEESRNGYFTWQPLSCGAFINSVLSREFWVKEPSYYPDGGNYYRFSSKLRFHLFVGQRYTYHPPAQYRNLPKSISATWELSTCDLYVLSKAVNRTLPLKDILSLSLGLMVEI